MNRSLKRNGRKKAWLGAAITGLVSLVGAGINAYTNYRNNKQQLQKMKEQEEMSNMAALSEYYQNGIDKNDQLQINANVPAKLGIRRSLKLGGASSSTGVSRRILDSNGDPTNLFFSDGTNFYSTVDKNGKVINIPNAKSHEDPTKGRHGNIDIIENGKQKPVVQVENDEAFTVDNGVLKVLSDTYKDPKNPSKSLSKNVIMGNASFDENFAINEDYNEDMDRHSLKRNRKKANLGFQWDGNFGSTGLTNGDVFTTGVNLATGIGKSIFDIASARSLRKPANIFAAPYISRITRYNNNPELAAIEENRVRNNDYIKRNVISGAGGADMYRRNNNDALQSTIASDSNKQKTEIGLMNEDIAARNEHNRYAASIASQNAANEINYLNEKNKLISKGWGDLFDNINNTANSLALNIENRRTNKMNAIAAIMMGNSASRRDFALRHRELFNWMMRDKNAADRELEGYTNNSLNSNAQTITEEYGIQDSDMRRWKTMPQNQLEKELKSRGYSDETIASIYDELQYFGKFGCRKSLKRI